MQENALQTQCHDEEVDELDGGYAKQIEVAMMERNVACKRAEEMASQNESLSFQLGDLQEQNQKLADQSKRLRSLIIKGSHDDEQVGDNTLVQKFISLREQIQAIVFKLER